MQLRRIRPSEDLVAIQEVENAARSRYLDDPKLAFVAGSAPIALERLQAGELVVAEDEGRIVGFILTTPMDGGLYIANISVAPGQSGRGIGAALIREALARASTRGLIVSRAVV